MKVLEFSRRQVLAGAAAAGTGVLVSKLTGHGIARATAAATDKSVAVRMARDIQVLDPGYMVGGAEYVTQVAVLPALARVAPGDEWQWQPTEFVTRLEQTDDLSIAFVLRPGLMWSGGHGEFTADDVKYSIERLKESEWSGRWEAVSHVEVTDKYNGVIVLNYPFAPIWLTALAAASGAIVSRAATEAAGGRFTTQIPSTLGAFTYEWTPNQQITFTRDPSWTARPPEYAVVNYILVEDDNSAELAFEAGEINLTEVTPSTAERWRDNPPRDSVMKAISGQGYTWMGMNTEHPSLQDIRVRKAIQRAVDPSVILQAAYGGLAPQSNGIVPPGLLGHRESKNFSFDPGEARRLLADAGVTDLSLTLQVLNQQTDVTSAQIIQQQLADVGIEVEVIPLDAGPFWNLGQESKGDAYKDLQLWIMGYSATADPFDHFQWFVSSQVGVWNWERWSDPEFDALYEQGTRETDTARRNQTYKRLGDIMEDTGAYVWITHEPAIRAWNTFVGDLVGPGGAYNFVLMTYQG